MTGDGKALSVVGLETRYGDRQVLRGLSLDVEAGQIYGLLGPNGAGKTTLIRSICGRVKPVAGSIKIAGQPNSQRSALRRIGLVPQEIALYHYLTVRENLTVFGRLSGLSRNETSQAIDWVTAAADLTQRIDERVEILSGGWKRRANIAAAILHQPALLILDEPTVGVDVEARNGLHDLIKELSRTGMGVLLTTHDMEQAEALCDQVGFLQHGRIDLAGNPRELVENAYHGHKEIIVELREPASPRLNAQLLNRGFQAANAGRTWSSFGQFGKVDAENISAQLEQAGFAVRELRVRQPGLDSLFIQLNKEAVETSSEQAA